MPSQVGAIRIVVADDHPIFLEGLRALLLMDPGMEMVGEAADGVEAVRLVKELSPDVLLLDLSMPRLGGLEVLRELAGSGVKIVIFAADVPREVTLQALRLGASGVLLKDSAPHLVFTCIRRVTQGEHWIGGDGVDDIVKTMAQLESRAPSKTLPGVRLTPRETEVLALVVAGYSNRSIAEKFDVSIETVKHHLTHIFDKTGVSNRLELALYAIQHHLV